MTMNVAQETMAPVTGELQGSATAVQLPDIPCKMVMFVAQSANTGNVYLGFASTVTVAQGAEDNQTTGFELAASAQTPWIPVSNLNQLYLIADNATDDVLYMALQ